MRVSAMRKRGLFVLAAALLAGTAHALTVSIAQLDPSGLLLSQRVDGYISVTDDQGVPVPGLGQGAFAVEESSDGKHYQSVPRLMTVAPGPGAARGITFLLLVDNSGSMYDTIAGASTTDPAQMRITHAKEAVRAFLASMTDPADRVGLIAFNTYATVLARPTAGRELVGSLLDDIRRPTPQEAYTELFASLTLAAREFAGVKGRKAIIVLSDGENFPYFLHSGKEHPVFGSKLYGSADPILACQEEGVTIYGISFGPEKEKTLQSISVETGGTLLDAASAEELTGAYQTIHRQVQGEYRVTWRAGTAPAERRYVRVSVEAAGNRASATRFYFASTVLGLPLAALTPLLLIAFLLAIALGWLLTFLKLEPPARPANLQVLQTQVGRPSTRVLPLTASRTVIGRSRSADLTIEGAPQVREEHATILFDPKDKSYTVVGEGEVRVNNQPVRTRKLEPGDVIDVGGATIVFDETEGQKSNDSGAKKGPEEKRTRGKVG
jgi:Ca-activated chloride channel homolog